MVATVPLKLSHVKYNHSNDSLINVVHAEYTRIITKSSFDCLIYVDGAQCMKEFLTEKSKDMLHQLFSSNSCPNLYETMIKIIIFILCLVPMRLDRIITT